MSTSLINNNGNKCIVTVVTVTVSCFVALALGRERLWSVGSMAASKIHRYISELVKGVGIETEGVHCNDAKTTYS